MISILPKTSLLGDPKSCMSWEKKCPSTHQSQFNCWKVVMTSLFLSLYKVNTKLVTTDLCMALGHLPCYADVGTKFSFCGNSYMIAKSKIDVANLGLFILSHVSVPPKQSVALMPFCGPLYSRFDYLNIVKYKHNISMYSMGMNDYASGNFNKKNLLYIDGHPWTHGNIAGFINSCRSSLFSENCSFEEHSNDKEFFMKRKASIFLVVHAICSLSLGDKLLIKYNFRRPPTTHQKCFAFGLPLDVPLGHKKKMIE
jgi:hypothetical protein